MIFQLWLKANCRNFLVFYLPIYSFLPSQQHHHHHHRKTAVVWVLFVFGSNHSVLLYKVHQQSENEHSADLSIDLDRLYQISGTKMAFSNFEILAYLKAFSNFAVIRLSTVMGSSTCLALSFCSSRGLVGLYHKDHILLSL